MSRREDRDSRGKRLRSRPHGDPSPKRSKDSRPVSERTYSNRDDLEIMNKKRQTKWDQKHCISLPDADTLVASTKAEKAQTDSTNKEVDKKAGTPSANNKNSSDRTDMPRSRSYHQHDERGIAGQGGRSFDHRATELRGWRRQTLPKERSGDKNEENVSVLDLQERDEKISDTRRKDTSHTRDDDNDASRHEEHHESETVAPTARRRPAFRENKLPTKEPENAQNSAEAALELARDERSVSGSARREERGHPRGHGSYERTFAADNRNGNGDGSMWRRDVQRAGYQPRERFGRGGGGVVRGRDSEGRYRDRNQYQFVGNQVEKWKHDLFDETNRSPTPMNEEDQIAKIEALLAL